MPPPPPFINIRNFGIKISFYGKLADFLGIMSFYPDEQSLSFLFFYFKIVPETCFG